MILTPMVIADTPPPPTCSIPNKEVALAQAATPVYPAAAADIGLGPILLIARVTVNPDGSVDSVVLMQSSHNLPIDEEALRAARASTYSSKVVGCNAATGTALVAINMMSPDMNWPSSILPVPATCDQPDREASVIRANVPGKPASTRSLKHPVEVLIEVTVAPNGDLMDAPVIRQSSNDVAIDQAAVTAARASTYAPRLVNCAPTFGTYTLRVPFAP